MCCSRSRGRCKLDERLSIPAGSWGAKPGSKLSSNVPQTTVAIDFTNVSPNLTLGERCVPGGLPPALFPLKMIDVYLAPLTSDCTMPPIASIASEVTLPPGWDGSRPKKPSAAPSIGDLAPFLGFIAGLFIIGLILNFALRLIVLGFESLTGLDCGLANYVSVLAPAFRSTEVWGEGRWTDFQHHHEDRWGRMRACTADHYPREERRERAPLVQQPRPRPPPMYAPPPSPLSAGPSQGPLMMPQSAPPPPYDPRDPTAASPLQDYGATRSAKSM